MSLLAMWIGLLDTMRLLNKLFSELIVTLAPVSRITFVVCKFEEKEQE